jgi:very-short-patch-repair endonuclease
MWGLPLVGEPPGLVFVRNVSRGRYGHDVKVVVGGMAETVVHEGVCVVHPSWTVADCARLLPRHQALMVADAALHEGLCEPAHLDGVVSSMGKAKGVGAVRWVRNNADRSAESPGESWCRLVLRELGYEVRSQVLIRDGDFAARVDFLLEGTNVIVEFDGLMKYGAAGAVAAEKHRQARLEALGYVVIRVVWEQLMDPARLQRRIRSVMAGR